MSNQELITAAEIIRDYPGNDPRIVKLMEIALASLTTPPAPVDLSALVPDEPSSIEAPSHLDEYEATCWIAGACWLRAEILRRIEGEDKC